MFSEIKNIQTQSEDWGMPLWQHPQVLFAWMGGVTIAIDLFVYLVANNRITELPLIITVLVAITSILLVITFVLQNSFERIAEAHKMKSEFISIVSHQLRSPVTNLRWALDTMKDENEVLAETESFNQLDENVNRVRDMISNLLIASRLEANRLVGNKESLDLNKLIEENIHALHSFAQQKNIEVKFSPNKNTKKILSDHTQAGIVVNNLIDNAIKYSRKNSTINVWVEERKGKNYNYVFIKDTGYGIPDDDKKYVFDKFFRASNVRQHLPDGSGLGLYIISEIMKRSGGDIGFDTKMGVGSTFWVAFPTIGKH